MNDVDADACPFADGDGLFHGTKHAGVFVSHVSRIDPAVLARHLAQLDQLRCRDQVRRRHQKGRGKAHGAFLHGLGQLRFHGLHLRRRGRFVIVPFDIPPELAFAHIRADVGGHAFLFNVVEIAAQRSPRITARLDRSGRSALAEHHGGDSLANHALALGLIDHALVGVIVHVDEAGRDHEAGGVDGAPARRLAQIADGGGLAGADPHVGPARFGAGPVED